VTRPLPLRLTRTQARRGWYAPSPSEWFIRLNLHADKIDARVDRAKAIYSEWEKRGNG
jgi:hypothetical protein